ncbi:hypothetical protein [uncultured Sunxiuqinia sp.]|uniref:hypothetical protein n=1 Tax=uncultured Sunxiuqinia sp. TaxID=1573825 RepID=UPI0026122CF3|nr:hypothetical protein [uncultured Sunxiuqinia sp.]
MAKIKSEKYQIGEKEINVNFNCNSRGVFSCNLHTTLQEELGLKGRLEFPSLKELEETIDKAVLEYKNSKTSHELIIGIKYGASGQFSRNEKGETFPEFLGAWSKYSISASFREINSIIGFDFRVLIKENRDGRIKYFEANRVSDSPQRVRMNRVVGDFVSNAAAYLQDNEKLIKYTEAAFNNLIAINKQLQRASEFLLKLAASEQLELILNSENQNLLQAHETPATHP